MYSSSVFIVYLIGLVKLGLGGLDGKVKLGLVGIENFGLVFPVLIDGVKFDPGILVADRPGDVQFSFGKLVGTVQFGRVGLVGSVQFCLG